MCHKPVDLPRRAAISVTFLIDSGLENTSHLPRQGPKNNT